MISSLTLRIFLAAFVTAALFGACTNTYLYDQRRDDEVPRDRTLTLEGSFCTPSPNEVVRPIKIIIAMDASQSMNVTDPNGTRAQATVDLLDNLPQEPEISFVVLLFAGSTSSWLSKSGLGEFDRVVDYTQRDKDLLRQRILNFTVPNNPNRDSTDFVKPLSDIYALINKDIAETRLMQMNDETRARYSAIFLSDGQPTSNQDNELLCGDAVRRIRQLKDLADDVKLNTVHVFIPTQPIASSACTFDAGFALGPLGTQCGIPDLGSGACPLLIVNQNAERLSRMANLGGGNFRDFRNNEPINFLNFQFGQVRRTFIFDKLVASNFSAPAGSPLDAADADSDSLMDADELVEGTLPWVSDSDTDGFSDGVEVWARDTRNGLFTPNQVPRPDGGGLDFGCPAELRGRDSDCDTLSDCDEQIIGTNAQRPDSDDDGISDSVEFKLGSQPSSKDLAQDPDNDRLLTGDEVTMHMNPLVVDSDNLSVTGYRYEVTKQGGLEPNGSQCWDFRISNVALANTMADTRDAGSADGGPDLPRTGAGFNDLFVTYSMRPGDDPTGRSILRTFRHTSSRFPVGGIKSPHDGIIKVRPEDFVAGCQSAAQSAP